MLDILYTLFKWVVALWLGYFNLVILIGFFGAFVAPFLVVWDFNKACKRFNNQ